MVAKCPIPYTSDLQIQVQALPPHCYIRQETLLLFGLSLPFTKVYKWVSSEGG